MEGFLVLLVLLVVFAPITISIVAIVKVSNLRQELLKLRRQLLTKPQLRPAPQPVKPADEAKTPVPVASPPSSPSHEAASAPAPKVDSALRTPVVPMRTRQAKPKAGLEFMMGGKAAAFAGIAILVTGIVFLVGYAIQNSWIGPGARVVLGLLSGGVLVGLGHFMGRKDAKYALFARVLTGGGSALFYFTVFASYAFYHLIGAVAAGAGLFACALAVFGLAMVYHAQSVAVLGVLGSFITPLLIGGDMDAGIFPLVYVALVNVPVILLGVRRKWQGLYNLSFAFTLVHFLIWMEWVGNSELGPGLGFAVLFFLQFAALGLLKLRCEQKVAGRNIDMIRLVSASLLLLGAVYWLLEDAEKQQWVGGAFLILALLHIALAQFAYKVLTRFNAEILAFLAGGLVFATLALPAQLDGEWVSLGWAVEGAVLAWFALRVQSRTLLAGAFLLGVIGMMKGLLFDVSLYENTPNLFINVRFVVGLLSAVLLGVQGKFAGKFPEEETSARWQDMLWWVAILGAVGVLFADTFWTLGLDDGFSWLITSLMLMGAGAAVLLMAPAKSSVTRLGSILLLLVPLKLLIVDAWIGLDIGGYGMTPFGNAIIWVELVMVAMIILVLLPRIAAREVALILPAPTFSRILNIGSLAAAIGVVSIEIQRKPDDWADMAVTILWAISALALILFGMKRRSAAHRYFGLVLFGLTTLKVLLVDSSDLAGLERIVAFIGTGILLLALSFAYQRASAYFQKLGEDD
ncbi:MAG: DUF2339 domain-containing protein [Kiritimatiellales bacterium]|nr:DUF2339 domain-containing protein [Kiritimatiellales bacterium]